MTLNEATRAQNEAASPEISTWLSANAGSGKTRVLTDRVARLLLRGAEPQSILCLTYTKAAAGEMQNRLFAGLGKWAMLPDSELFKELGRIGEDAPENLADARRLFARAIEAPGGLKIQTIHSFCSALLRQFPLEAGVSPGFRELDEAGQGDLIERVLDHLALEAPEALAPIARLTSNETLAQSARSVILDRAAFCAVRMRAEIMQAFGVSETLTQDRLVAETVDDDDLAFLRSVSTLLRSSEKVTDQKTGERLRSLPDQADETTIEFLESFLLTGPTANVPFSAKVGAIPTKGLRDGAFSTHLSRFNAIMERLADKRGARIALLAATHTWALHQFAQSLLPAYAKAKADAGVLDFDDLIERAGALLTDRSLNWVLYRLDGRIEHILVDEAQDTSPAQWSVINALAEEIAAGEGAERNTSRSLFVVGDKKQSIYSFQGADAREFDRMANHFSERMTDGLARRELLYSFRSSPAILQAVDATFDADGNAALGTETEHRAFFDELPGRVDLWPLQKRESPEDPPRWFDPVDRVSDGEPAVLLANRVADHIAGLIEKGTVPDENGGFRPIVASDFLILVQRRSILFDQLIRACKSRGLPMAGADKLKINAVLAVKDLTALLSFLALPEDDLSLAAALKSPLFSWSEADLYGLAAGRGKKYLWTALRENAENYPETFAQLKELRRIADFERPFELLEVILSKFGGRAKLIARLGAEAEDGIDELVAHALRYETNAVPSLTGFLAQLASEELEIKRPTDSSDGLVQVMTIHGAKGLERPIVILPDTVRGDPQSRGDFVVSREGLPVWLESRTAAPPMVTAAKDDHADIERAERLRLLYVAMTRAKTWLIVAGIEPGNTSRSAQWHDMVKEGLERLDATWIEDGEQRILRHETGNWTSGAVKPAETETKTRTSAAWAPASVLDPPMTQETVAPSDLGGEKAIGGMAGRDEDAARLRGTHIHTLLEHLPGIDPDLWPRIATRLLGEKTSEAYRDEVLSEATQTIRTFPDIFADNTLTEIEVSAHLPILDKRLDGTIDRILLTEQGVEIIDYKSNAVVPEKADDCPEGILRQMGAYLEAAQAIWPDCEVTLTILWTTNASRMSLSHDLVTSALARAAKS